MSNSIGLKTHVDGKIKVMFSDQANLVIGKYCSIAQELLVLLGGNHHSEWLSTYPFDKGTYFSKGDVIIGNDVWIGYGVTILSGVKIGDGAVIGAKSVIASDVDDYAIVCGNPAMFVRYRFSKKVINTLLSLKWWDWPAGKVFNAKDILQSGDAKALVKYAEKNDCLDRRGAVADEGSGQAC